MRNLISIVLMSLILSSCSSLQFKYQSLNTAAQVDAIYQATGIQPTVIESTSQAARMFNNDFRFRWNHQTFLNQQPYMWWANYYWDNRMWRFGWQSSWDLYTSWNYGAYTLGWSSWSPHRWSPFGYDRWGYNPWGYSHWNNWGMYGYGYNDWYWRNRMNTYAWNNRYRTNTVYVNGRRGSSNINNTISNRRRVNNVSRNNSNTNTIRVRPNNNNVIINNNSRPSRPSINNSRPSKPRGYGRPEINNNNNNNSRPVYTRPSSSSNINRGSNNSTRPSRSSGTRGGNTRK